MLDEAGIMYAGTQSTDDDKRLFVQFTHEARLDKAATAEAGMNKYRDVEFVTIRVPGDKTFSIHRPVTPSDKQRFPLQYAAFRNNAGEVVHGTPLSLWPAASPSRVKELEYFGVRTVEQLAAMPDSASANGLMGINSLRQAAKQFVELSKENAPVIKMQGELKARDAQIAALEASLKEQSEKVDTLISNLSREAPKRI